MKTIQSLCCFFFLTTIIFAQSSFEGTISYTISGKEQATTLVEVHRTAVEKILEVVDDKEAMKKRSDEMKQKMEAIQKQ